MRVLQVSATVSPLHGGPSELALNLNLALRRHGHDARILTSDALLTPVELQGLRANFPERAMRLCRSGRRLREKREWLGALRQTLRELPVVHIHGYYLWQTAAAALLCQRHGVPYLVHCHGIFEPYQTRQSRIKKSLFDLLVGRRILRRAAGLVFDTSAEQRVARLPNRVQQPRTFLIPPCPAEQPIITGTVPAQDRLTAPVVLFLARIAPKKRVDLAIAAMPLVLASHPEARLRIAGRDSEGLATEAIHALSPGCRSRVSLEGFVGGEAKTALLASSAVYVLPSENENFGISVAEALVTGLPVVISRHVALAADVKRHGAGVIIEELNAVSVAAAVLQVLEDPNRYAAMRDAARSLGTALYSVTTTVALAEAAYRQASALAHHCQRPLAGRTPSPGSDAY